MRTIETPVLIVGAGPVGLGLALDLGWRGQDCTIVEQGDGTVALPKLGAVNYRTMEFMRRWGIADEIYRSPFNPDYHMNMGFCTDMSGHFLARIPYGTLAEEPAPPESPERKWRCPQLWFDPILVRAVAQHDSVQRLYHHRFISFHEEPDRVVATVDDLKSGETFEIACQYLVACDGAGSKIRQTLDIGMTGRSALGHSVAIFLRSENLIAHHQMGEAERYIFVGPEGTWGNLTAIDGRDLWRLTVITGADTMQDVVAHADRHVRRCMGSDKISFEIISTLPWRRSQLTAERYGEGRLFLVGDSAHTMSPTGGLGMNTGMGDAVDLSWKVKAVLDGWAPSTLLQSYGPERQPIGERNVNASAHNYFAMTSASDCALVLDDGTEGDAARQRVAAQLPKATMTEWETKGLVLGYRYEDSPICVPDGTPPDADDGMIYRPTARPGHRAPHAWIAPSRSTLDLYGKGFTLLRFNGADPAAIVAAAKRKNVPLTVVDIANSDIAKLYERRLLLVRPDGHVAWRDDAAPADPDRLIEVVRGAAIVV
jgi:2-polyprenyl-6-methoxyphenol hydroxylase-like FAD-dependent oxidoreductase